MKKLLLILPILSIFTTESNANHNVPDLHELASITTLSPFVTTTEGFNKEEVKLQIADDLAKFDLSGEMTQALEQYILNAADSGMSIDQAIDTLEAMIK
jgi:hypothetical protein